MSKIQNELITKLSIEGFPSRTELYSILDNFLEEKGYDHPQREYSSDNKDLLITFSFQNPDLAFDFAKYLNIEKIKNNLYHKIKTKVTVDVKKPVKPLKILNLNVKSVKKNYLNASMDVSHISKLTQSKSPATSSRLVEVSQDGKSRNDHIGKNKHFQNKSVLQYKDMDHVFIYLYKI
jgi:hypothetical protein